MAVKTVQDYLEKHPKWEKELSLLREMLVSTGLEETIKWGAPTYSLDGKNVVGMAAFKNYYGLWFFQGALLKENTSLLYKAQEEKTKAMRQVRFAKEDQLKPELLRKYVLEAMKNQQEGKIIKPERNKQPLKIPSELDEAMKEDEDLKQHFYNLTPGKQREYAIHISEAKKESTRQSRLEKAVPMIKEGKGLYDKYKNC